MARTAARHGAGSEFSGLFGLAAGVAMAVGRGRLVRTVADLAGVAPGDRVVDVGSGPGKFLREAARRGAEATGIEPALQMRRLARRLTPARARASVTVLDGTAEDIPLEDGAATVAWAVSSVHHWADVDAGLAETHRVLAPGGRLLLVERLARPGGWFQHHAASPQRAEELASRATAAGFTEVAVQRHALGRYQFVLVKARRPAPLSTGG
jgi:ubiquinone/menaquinone biosynthesis C-methylase UbiE